MAKRKAMISVPEPVADAAGEEAVQAQAQAMYGSPTFEQVERLIEAVKAGGGGQPGGSVSPEDIAGFVDGAEYDPAWTGEDNVSRPAILLKHGDRVVASIDATPFVADGLVLGSPVEVSGPGQVCTAADRTVNRIVVPAGLSAGTLAVSLPDASSSLARTLVVRFEVGDGATVDGVSFVDSSGVPVAVEPSGIPAPSAGSTVVRLTEMARDPALFLCQVLSAPEPQSGGVPEVVPSAPGSEWDGTVEAVGTVDRDGTASIEAETLDDGTVEAVIRQR